MSATSAVPPAIRTSGLTKRFGATVAVDGLDLTVAPGQVFGFLGPNGAGKSTTIRLLLGLIHPSSGTAEVFGVPAADVRRAHRHLAYVPADVALWPALTGAELLELLARVGPGIDADYRAELMVRFGLDPDKPARTYSTGNRQKVALVAAFATRAALLVLDEPASGLDPLMELEFRRCIDEARERGQTVFLSSHQLAEVDAVCDRVAILRAGRLVEIATIAELRRLRRTLVEVSYRDTAPSLVDVPGVHNFERLDGARLRFTLSGEPAAVLRALAAAEITTVTMREPTLEEIFLDYYGDITPMSTPLAAVTQHAVREVRRGALVVALAAAGISAVVAVQYRTMFADTLDTSAVRALAANPAIRVLFGPPVALDDVGGFTVWRTGAGVQILLAVWALLTATRITRGEEDAGRADLLLAGRLRNSDVVTRRLGAVAAGTLATGAALLVALLATGTQPVGALVHAAGTLGTGLTFAAAGTLAAQVLPNRAAATGAAVALLGVDVLLRMLSDIAGGGTPLAWLAWLTPFGLTVHAAPYADNRVTPLVVLVAVAALLAAAAIAAARHRDVGGALVAVRTTRRPRIRLLGSLTGFATRRALRPTTGWALGLAAYFLFVGTLATSILRFLQDNPRFADLAATAGFPRLQTATGLAAAMFGLLAIPAGLYAATRIAALATDETGRRWTTTLALPITRTRLAATEAAITAAGILTLVIIAGLALWAGSPVDLPAALGGALNATPVAALSLGAAVLALGWAPRAVAAIGSLPVAGGFLLLVIARTIHAPAWVADLSPFAHLSPVPDAPPDWPATTILTTIAALLTALGLAGYTRRDLTT